MAGDDDDVVVAATSPSRVEFFVRRQGTSARYRIEVVVRDHGMLPSVVAIRYPTAQGRRVLLVPVVAGPFGVAASQAEFSGLEQEALWEAAEPVPFGEAPWQGWDGDVVASSVAAAASQATRAAWGELRDAAVGDLAAAIDRVL
jgi:hypothetical protein